jgi:hypothetical protein
MSAHAPLSGFDAKHQASRCVRIAEPRTPLRSLLIAAVVALGLFNSDAGVCHAEDEAPSIVGYGLEGLGTGAAVGLGVGYLATGSEFKSAEWRTLIWGTGIGALTGLGVGILLGTIDAAIGRERGIGFYMLRDSNYGVTVGFLAGAIVGAMIWASDGSGKDLLISMSWGMIIGGGAGLILGVVEGVLRGSPRPSSRPSDATALRVGFSFVPTQHGAPVPYPTLSGHF